MAFHIELADRVRRHLARFPALNIQEKQMFGGLAFMIDDKMCINVSGENLMCRFDPALTAEVAERQGFLPMVMKGRHYKGYCYVEPGGFADEEDFEYWMKLCLDFNKKAKSSKRRS